LDCYLLRCSISFSNANWVCRFKLAARTKLLEFSTFPSTSKRLYGLKQRTFPWSFDSFPKCEICWKKLFFGKLNILFGLSLLAGSSPVFRNALESLSFLVDERSRFFMRVSNLSNAPKVGSCVACTFEGIGYVDLEAFWRFLSEAKLFRSRVVKHQHMFLHCCTKHIFNTKAWVHASICYSGSTVRGEPW